MNKPRTAPLQLGILVGTRPEAIKQAPIMLEAQRNPALFKPTLINTGQHREMTADTLASFGLRADVNFEVMQSDPSLSGLLSRVLEKTDQFLREQQLDVLLVQGDTTSSMGGGHGCFSSAGAGGSCGSGSSHL